MHPTGSPLIYLRQRASTGLRSVIHLLPTSIRNLPDTAYLRYLHLLRNVSRLLSLSISSSTLVLSLFFFGILRVFLILSRNHPQPSTTPYLPSAWLLAGASTPTIVSLRYYLDRFGGSVQPCATARRILTYYIRIFQRQHHNNSPTFRHIFHPSPYLSSDSNLSHMLFLQPIPPYCVMTFCTSEKTQYVDGTVSFLPWSSYLMCTHGLHNNGLA